MKTCIHYSYRKPHTQYGTNNIYNNVFIILVSFVDHIQTNTYSIDRNKRHYKNKIALLQSLISKKPMQRILQLNQYQK
jgi:hypothetical protein